MLIQVREVRIPIRRPQGRCVGPIDLVDDVQNSQVASAEKYPG
jgi:hypothetical protein